MTNSRFYFNTSLLSKEFIMLIIGINVIIIFFLLKFNSLTALIAPDIRIVIVQNRIIKNSIIFNF